ncbi:hypothetical protein [Bacillus infantis]|uniref:hypothetical protein n=1 Tax=Bacillus infantis TaxID=324767 RepID=UPI00301658F9
MSFKDWEERIINYEHKHDYHLDIETIKEKIKRAKFYLEIAKGTEQKWEKTAHAITAIQNIHFQGDSIGKLLAHNLIGKKIRVRKKGGGYRKTNSFYLLQVVEDLKRQRDYLSKNNYPSKNEAKNLFTEMVNSWSEFLNSNEWTHISFISNEEKHNRFFKGDFTTGKFIIPITNKRVEKVLEDDELEDQINEFEELGLEITDRQGFKENMKEVLSVIHDIDLDMIEKWQEKVLGSINENMTLLCDYKNKLLEQSEDN